ncbi:MAG: diguanylate cyclase [Pseudomonadota bacterium]
MRSRSTTKFNSAWRALQVHFRETFSGHFTYSDRESAESDKQRALKRGRDAYRYILAILVCVVIPMTVHNGYSGQTTLAFLCVGLLALFVANITLLSLQRSALIEPSPLLGLVVIVILFAVSLGQSYAVYWLYPLLAALPVLMRSYRAQLFSVIAGLVTVSLLFAQFDFSAAVVLSFSMALTWLVSAWLVFAVTEQSRRLRNMAVTDPLTGAYNRRYLEEQAAQALEAWQRYGHSSTMLLIDVDFFKRVNDLFGHTAGDAAIRSLVEVMSSRLRAVDTLCRFGGEEFVVLLQETDMAGATQLAEELRLLIENAKILPTGNMTISIGVCEVVSADSVDHWFKLADSALYIAKRNGRNRVESSQDTQSEGEPTVSAGPG